MENLAILSGSGSQRFSDKGAVGVSIAHNRAVEARGKWLFSSQSYPFPIWQKWFSFLIQKPTHPALCQWAHQAQASAHKSSESTKFAKSIRFPHYCPCQGIREPKFKQGKEAALLRCDLGCIIWSREGHTALGGKWEVTPTKPGKLHGILAQLPTIVTSLLPEGYSWFTQGKLDPGINSNGSDSVHVYTSTTWWWH